MARQIVECIPNFSEGRRPEVVEVIVAAIDSVEGVALLDQSSDEDHNRSVVTFAGPPAAVEAAAFQAIAKAAELIDLNKHQGEHPRIGATDVVPFVPISGVSMVDCVEMARRLGARVGEELGIPVYLYEEAATRPDRVNLEDIRRGQYEALKDEISMNLDRAPDFGPAQLGPAGATVIGARAPLIAYNVYLNTDDVSKAKAIAKVVRQSSGGMRFVKGAGFLVDGRAQVSMNLTNFRKTPVFRVVEMIRREAARYGLSIEKSELIGLIPGEALIDSAAWYLQLDDFDPGQVLETRLQDALEGDAVPVVESDFLADLASGEPTPGGGSAAAFSGAMAAGLVAMVARLTVGKKKYRDVEGRMYEVIARADELRAGFTEAVQEDAAAYQAVMAAFRLPKETEKDQAKRGEAIQEAMLHAAEVPLRVAGMAVETLDLAAIVAEQGNSNAICDAGTGAAMALSALRGAELNVRVNAVELQDEAKARELLDGVGALEVHAAELEKKVNKAITDHGGLSR